MTNNKKVKNATQFQFEGIVFRSHLEMLVYQLLTKRGLNPLYEPDKITVIDGFRPNNIWFKDGKPIKIKQHDVTYTPDFRFEIGDKIIYLEVKGWETDTFPLKRKLFLRKLQESPNAVYVQIRTLTQLTQTLDYLQNN